MDKKKPAYPYIITDDVAEEFLDWPDNRAEAMDRAAIEADQKGEPVHIYRLIAIVEPMPKPRPPKLIAEFTEEECEHGKEA